MTLFQSGGLVRQPALIHVERLPLDAAMQAQLRALSGRSRPVCLSLDPNVALAKRITIPRTTPALRERAVALNIRQTMPNQGTGLIWRSIPAVYRDTQVDYNVYMFKDAVLQQLARDAQSLGVTVERMVIDGVDVPSVWELRPGVARQRAFWLTATALGVLGVALWSVVSMERRVASLGEARVAGEARIAALEERLVAMRAEKEAGVAQQNATLMDLAQFNMQSRRLRTFTALTDILPDSVWISELSFTGDSVLMSGFVTGDVAEIVTLLQAQEWAKSVRLEGPITYDSYSGQNRFDLGLQIAGTEEITP